MYSHMADHGVEVSTIVAQDVPDNVLLDPLRVRQVLANGITNALKLTKAGSVRIQVTTHGGEALVCSTHHVCVTPCLC